jgi:hypothetical protein
MDAKYLQNTFLPSGKGRIMNMQNLKRVSGMILLAVAVSLAVLALVYALQNPNLVSMMAVVS